jgi:hypothetical protein
MVIVLVFKISKRKRFEETAMKKHLALVNLLALLISALVHLFTYTDLLPHSIAIVRESRPLVFLPANLSLATWLIIYLSLLIYAVYQSRSNSQELRERASFYFLFSSIGKITWTILYVFGDMWMSMLALVMTLGALIMLYEKLKLRFISFKQAEYWLVHFPFSIFLGWVSVLLVLNVATALYDSGYQSSFLGLTADIWTVVLLAFLLGMACLMLFTLNDFAYALTIAWGALTIFLRPFHAELYSQVQSMNLVLVELAAFTTFASLFLLVGIYLILNWRGNPKLVVA